MWNRSGHRLSFALAFGFVCAARIGAALVAQARLDLTGGLGADVVGAKCVTCHRLDMIRQQRLTRIGWERELDKMIRWGASVTNSERDPVLDYLAANFAPQASSPASSGPGTRGAEVFRRSCLACHQADMVEQQRLNPAAWAREVDKMKRWGAVVGDDDKEPLVSYLAKEFGPAR